MLLTEYIGNIPAEKRDETIAQLNTESARLIKVKYNNNYVTTTWVSEKLIDFMRRNKLLFVFTVFHLNVFFTRKQFQHRWLLMIKVSSTNHFLQMHFLIPSLSLSLPPSLPLSFPLSLSLSLSGEREVNVGGTPCMCGGTHVKNTSEIRGITVTKIKKVHGVHY